MGKIPDHGTASRYQGSRRNANWAPCRCDLCRAAFRRDEKVRELRRLRGIPSYAPIGPVAAHVRVLLESGWTLDSITREANVSRRALGNWLNNPPSGVQHEVAARVLVLKPATTGPLLVPALGSARRLQALAAMGWPVSWSGPQAGITDTYARLLVRGRHGSVGAAVAARIDAVYRRHCMIPGPSEFARAHARRNEWVTAVAWDDIDDPKDKPHSVIGRCERRRRTAA
jgi:lambda repressor-like predicted transcriptional regulator